jgi:hypothetical protein
MPLLVILSGAKDLGFYFQGTLRQQIRDVSLRST